MSTEQEQLEDITADDSTPSTPQAQPAPTEAAPAPQSQPVPAATSEAGLSTDVVLGLAGQATKMIEVLERRSSDQLKLLNAQRKLREALTWLNDATR